MSGFTDIFLLLFLLMALAIVAWYVAWLAGRRPRFLRLAFGLCTASVALIALWAVTLVGSTLAGDDSTSIGAPVAIGHGGIEVTAPIYVDVGRTPDPKYDADIARYYGEGARIFDADEVTVAVAHPSTGLWVAAIGTVFLGFAVAAIWLLTLRAILGRALAGEPFHERNVRGLRTLALLTIASGLLSPVVDQLVMTAVIHEAGGTESAAPDLSLFVPMAVGVLLLALAEVWSYGIELQRDAEATV